MISAGDASSDNSSKSPGKKQHRIRRRLLMGGLIKRKNRSLPDLRADQEEAVDAHGALAAHPQDLSHYAGFQQQLEEAGAGSNPNLEKSKLMRKNVHPSLGRPLHTAKVPPPPPLRKTSHLSMGKPESSDLHPADIYDHHSALAAPGYRKFRVDCCLLINY